MWAQLQLFEKGVRHIIIVTSQTANRPRGRENHKTIMKDCESYCAGILHLALVV